MTQVVQYGLVKGHQFYSMDISGFPEDHKQFLQDELQTVHGYSWLVNLDDSYNPFGEHHLYVRADPENIFKIIQELIAITEDDDEPGQAPIFLKIDPDERSSFQKRTVRERFFDEYPILA